MKVAVIAVAMLLLAACASTKEPAPAQAASAPVPAAAAKRSNADELLAYMAQVRTMPDTALATEAAKRKREGDLGRIKAAVALSFSTQSDETEILALVDPVEKRAGDRDVKAMAGFLQAMALERRRVKESSAARLRDEHKALDAQRQRADDLQQKLEALSDLEKSLSNRPSEH